MVKMGILLLEINEHLRRRVERDRLRKELPLRQIILALARDVLNLVEGGLQNPSFPRRGEPRHGFFAKPLEFGRPGLAAYFERHAPHSPAPGPTSASHRSRCSRAPPDRKSTRL